jgi:hypothetical protein
LTVKERTSVVSSVVTAGVMEATRGMRTTSIDVVSSPPTNAPFASTTIVAGPGSVSTASV